MPDPQASEPRPSKRQAVVDARKAQLLEVGAEVLARSSFDAPWTDEVADQAGVSKTLIYHHFGNKRGFYIAILQYVIQHLYERWQQTAVPLIAQAAGPKHVVRAGLQAFLDQAGQYPAAYRTASKAGHGQDAEITALHDEVYERAINMIALFFRLDPIPPLFRLACRGWLAFVESATLDWLDNPELDRDELIEVLRASLRTLLPLKDGPVQGELEPAPIERPGD